MGKKTLYVKKADGKMAGSVSLEGKTPPTANDVAGAEQESAVPEGNHVGEVYGKFKNMKEYCDLTIPPLPGPGEPKEVRIMRGLPGSGKSTWAESVMDAYPEGTVVRLNNDDICKMTFGNSFPQKVQDMPELLANLRHVMLAALLANPTVRMVIIDNTNLVTRTVSKLAGVATTSGATTVVDDRFLEIPLEECLRRNAGRDRVVPAEAIRGMHKQASRLTPWTPPPALIKYDNSDENLPEVTLVDLDGTLARISPDRGPYEWHKVGLDSPNPAVVSHVRGLLAQGKEVVVFSARDGAALEESQKWVDTHVGKGVRVIHKGVNDNRSAQIVKPDLFHKYIAGNYRVASILDDDASVVAAFRYMGLPVWQVEDSVHVERSKRPPKKEYLKTGR